MGHANPTAARGGTAAYINANRRLVGQTDLLANMTAIARLAVVLLLDLPIKNVNPPVVGTKMSNVPVPVIARERENAMVLHVRISNYTIELDIATIATAAVTWDS